MVTWDVPLFRDNLPYTYCWWKKSCTNGMYETGVNHGINCQPQVVNAGFPNHQQYHRKFSSLSAISLFWLCVLDWWDSLWVEALLFKQSLGKHDRCRFLSIYYVHPETWSKMNAAMTKIFKMSCCNHFTTIYIHMYIYIYKLNCILILFLLLCVTFQGSRIRPFGMWRTRPTLEVQISPHNRIWPAMIHLVPIAMWTWRPSMWIWSPLLGDPQIAKFMRGFPTWTLGGPLFPKTLRNNEVLIQNDLFSRFFRVWGDPQSSCGESPHELWGSPERGPPIHMMNTQQEFRDQEKIFG